MLCLIFRITYTWLYSVQTLTDVSHDYKKEVYKYSILYLSQQSLISASVLVDTYLQALREASIKCNGQALWLSFIPNEFK